MNLRIDASIAMLSRLACLPLAFEERASMVKVVVASKALYGGGTSFVSPTKMEQLRTACVRALRRAGDRGRARRSKELVLNLIAGKYNSEIDPAFVLLWKRLWTIRKWVVQDQDKNGSKE